MSPSSKRAFAAACAAWWSLLAAAAPEAPPAAPLDEARAAAESAEWGRALDAYTEHLRGLTTREYRDKKTYVWLLDELEKAAPEGAEVDREPLAEAAEARLSKSGKEADPVTDWRLHHLLAEIAARDGNADEARSHRLEAIKAYPSIVYAEPDKHSRLQHLYNEVARAQAEKDPEAAEKYLLDSFLEDSRFVYVYLPPWRDVYEDEPEKFEAFRLRVLEAYDAKAEKSPDLADALVHYRRALADNG